MPYLSILGKRKGPKMSIYQRIQDLAKQKKLTVRDIERALNYANGSLRKWKDNANSQKLVEVANYLGVSTDYLLGRDASPSKGKDKGANVVDLKDDDVILTYEGKPIPPEDLKLIQRLMNSTRNDL